MLTIHDLLADPTYREFITTRPQLPSCYGPERKPYRLMVMLKGEHVWRQKRFETYDDMFKAFKKLLPKIADAALQTPAVQSPRPQRVARIKGKYFTNNKGEKLQVTKLIEWKPKMPIDEFEPHYWCPYCRRPTVFRQYRKHHALPPSKTAHIPIDPALMRCSICGASENLVKLRG